MTDPHVSHSAGDAPRPWTTLILLAVAQFMVVLDITVVNVALPSIGHDLGLGGDDLQWVVTIYVLLTGGLLLLGGRIADAVSRRGVFLAGLTVFTAASLASGLAESGTTLIAARAAQGIGAALLTPAALSIVTSYYTGRQLTTALAAWSAIGSAGAAVGVVLGGLLTTWLSWEWIFLVNVPVGLVALVAATRVLPVVPTTRRALDVPGALLVVAGMITLVFAIDGAAEHGWGSTRTLGLLALAIVLLAAFALVEAKTVQPLVPPATWRTRPLVAGAAVILGVTAILVGTFFLNSLYMQEVIGASALETGLGFLPLAFAIGVTAHVAPRIMARIGSRLLIVAGMSLVAAGALVLAIAPDRATYFPELLPGLVVIGLGVGFVFPAASVTAFSLVAPHQLGLASGLISTAHELGAALGVAVLAAVAAIATATGPVALAAGYEDGFIAAAAIALGFAAVAASAVPTVKPAAGASAAVH
ncbi:MFS transporter [Solirubrobacter sp. CPCC 204708]|uniref:MFS transporter n=1 Tax=Solirubrobacter deserti TaxID=2282478 RepID=A0ABT4RQT4_9ACTN|nr:MFS transporter [Solirubrobacter deserti]MBE2320704.1 MFS transporter [Solirubrobacter deserti]MDA0140928.1 MFS transporter [Solirubrobacter deserti]